MVSSGEVDTFEGSSSSQNDVLDARVAHDLEFADVAGGKISVKSGTDVNAHLSDVDYIMVTDTGSDVDFYQDMSHLNLSQIVDDLEQELLMHTVLVTM